MALQKYIQRLVTRLFNLGIDTSTSSLNILRYRYINTFNFIAILGTLFHTIYRFINGPQFNGYWALVVLFLFMFSLYLSSQKKLESSILLTVAVLNINAFIAAYFFILEPVEIVPQLLFIVFMSVVILRTTTLRISFIVICLSMFMLLIPRYDLDFIKSIATLLQITAGFAFIFSLVKYLERQDRKVNKTLAALEESNNNITYLNQQLNIKNNELITFSNVMSHDLKAPIKNVIAFCDLLQKTNSDNLTDAQSQYISVIERSGHSMKTLVDDLLSLSEISSLQDIHEPVNLNEVIQNEIENFTFDITEKNIDITVKDLPSVTGNKKLIGALFHNLLSNAIKYQPDNTPNHTPCISIYTLPDHAPNIVYVKDNGIGIQSQNIHKLFEPFTRMHTAKDYEGSGLGLAICNRVMEKHQGSITLDHTSSKGTTFKLAFRN